MGSADTLRAGAARVDLTPELGTQLAGDIGRHRPAEEIRERLYANALVVELGPERLGLLSLDLAVVTEPWLAMIRAGVAARTGLPADRLAVHAVQNHAAPALGHLVVSDGCRLVPPELPWLRGGDDAYHPWAVEQCVRAVSEAAAAVEPVTVRAGRGVDGRVAFNRRFVMRDGTAVCHPAACDPSILHVEGPTDPEVGVVTFTDARHQVAAVLLHHTCHPCHGYPHRFVIGDWPGVWGELVREECGPQCVPLVLNGCCGNIHHANHLDPHTHSDHAAMARLLMESTARVLQGLAPVPASGLGVHRTVLRVPLRELPPGELAAARELVAEYPEPKWVNEERTQVDWDWVYAVSRLDLHALRERDPLYACEVQVLRLGDVALAALTGEPFVEGQLEIKLHSPASHTLVAHNCNGFGGYVPTPEALRRGGYETRTAQWSKLGPEALDRMVSAAGDLLQEAFA